MQLLKGADTTMEKNSKRHWQKFIQIFKTKHFFIQTIYFSNIQKKPKTEGFKSLEQLHGETKIVSKESTVFRECALDYYLVTENEKVLIVVLTPMATSSEQLELHMSLMSETSLQISVVVRVHPNVWKGVAIKTKFEVDTLVQKMPPSRYNGIVLFPYPVVYNGVSAATVEINNYFSLFVFEKKHKTHAPALYHVEKIDSK